MLYILCIINTFSSDILVACKDPDVYLHHVNYKGT